MITTISLVNIQGVCLDMRCLVCFILYSTEISCLLSSSTSLNFMYIIIIIFYTTISIKKRWSILIGSYQEVHNVNLFHHCSLFDSIV